MQFFYIYLTIPQKSHFNIFKVSSLQWSLRSDLLSSNNKVSCCYSPDNYNQEHLDNIHLPFAENISRKSRGNTSTLIFIFKIQENRFWDFNLFGLFSSVCLHLLTRLQQRLNFIIYFLEFRTNNLKKKKKILILFGPFSCFEFFLHLFFTAVQLPTILMFTVNNTQ